VRFRGSPTDYISHSGNNQFEFVSKITTQDTDAIYILDQRGGTSEPITTEVDYIGAINITDLVSRGILPSGLSNDEYKEMIDRAMFANVPLRETDYIAVEPSKAYKLIKVSANEVTHKVIEYTTDNQVVKVTPVVYTTNKFIFTTHALTNKIKLVSDLMDKPSNVVSNSDLRTDTDTDNIPDGFALQGNPTINSLVGGVWNLSSTGGFRGVKTSTALLNADTAYYLYARIKTANNAIRIQPEVNSFHSGSNTFELLSGVYFGASTTFYVLDKRADGSASITWEVDTMGAYNITEFKNKGVKMIMVHYSLV
jgi:hypothetical protein